MRVLLPLAVLGWLTQASIARAQAVDPAAATPANADAETPAAAPAVDADAEKALFERGSRDYDEGRFDDAAAAFEEAHRLYGKPGYLFNLAQVRRMQKACGPALSAYRKYLANAPPDDQRRTLALRYESEMQRCAQPAVTRPPAPVQLEAQRTVPHAPRQSPAARWMRPAGIAAVGVGAASGVAAALFQWHARHVSNEVNAPGARFTQERVDQGQRSQRIAVGLLIGAVVAGSAGTTFLLVSPAAAPGDTGAAARGPVLVYAGKF